MNNLGRGAVGANPRGGVDVNQQDQTTQPLDLYFQKSIAAPTTLAVATVIDSNNITVLDDTNVSIGNYLGVFSNISGEREFYFGTVLGKPGAGVLNMDTPLDFAFSEDDPVIITTRDLNVNGSVTPQLFQTGGFGGGGSDGFAIDIYNISFSCQTAGAVDLNKFGDLAALAKGLILRRNNGVINNIWNIKTNGDMALLDDSWKPLVASNPAQGTDGFTWNYDIIENHGVAMRLETGDTIELIAQDALQSITALQAISKGHVVD